MMDAQSQSKTIQNAMSVDVEDYFQVSAFEKHVPRDQWERLPRRVEINTNRILDLFDQHNVKATFFILGWVAKRHSSLVRSVVSRGHELASHGFSHTRVCNQSREEFVEDIVSAKAMLEDVAGVPVRGYRAPTYSIDKRTLWALDELEAAGYRYSSSIYPIRHDLYGIPDAPRFPYRPNGGELVEIPISTVQLGQRNLPCGGGGYFRFFPYAVSRWAINRVNSRDRKPCVFYFHPWEIDPEQPRMPGLTAKARFRHYLNLDQMESRLSRLMQDFSWNTVQQVFLAEAA